MTSDHGECPGCTNPSPRPLTVDDQKIIPFPALQKIESAPGRALICGSCGCVYKVKHAIERRAWPLPARAPSRVGDSEQNVVMPAASRSRSLRERRWDPM